jgi:hypothetical protein
MENLVDKKGILELSLDVADKLLKVNVEKREDKSYFAYGGTESRDIGDMIVYKKNHNGHSEYHLHVKIQNPYCEVYFSEDVLSDDELDEEGLSKIIPIKKIYDILEKKVSK